MLQELEQIAIKYKKIAEYALDLKKQNTILVNQIGYIKQTMESLVDDKINLEHQNGLLNLQLTQIKTNIENILSNTDWECEANKLTDNILTENIPSQSINSLPILEEEDNAEFKEQEKSLPYFAINPSLGDFINDKQNSTDTNNTQGKLIFNNEQEILINHKM